MNSKTAAIYLFMNLFIFAPHTTWLGVGGTGQQVALLRLVPCLSAVDGYLLARGASR